MRALLSGITGRALKTSVFALFFPRRLRRSRLRPTRLSRGIGRLVCLDNHCGPELHIGVAIRLGYGLHELFRYLDDAVRSFENRRILRKPTSGRSRELGGITSTSIPASNVSEGSCFKPDLSDRPNAVTSQVDVNDLPVFLEGTRTRVGACEQVIDLLSPKSPSGDFIKDCIAFAT